MSGQYAKRTEVTPAKSRGEIEAVLVKYGCKQFGVMNDVHQVALVFVFEGVTHRIVMPLPSEKERLTKLQREQAIRSRWRALLLVVKARLEYATVTRQPLGAAFVEYRVLEGGKTVAEHVLGDGGTPPALTWGKS